jgi:ethanolamine permease
LPRCRSLCGVGTDSPLAAEESVDPRRDMPKGIMLGMFTLIVLGFLILIINPAIPIARQITDASGVATRVHGAFALGTSGEPILDGFRAILAGAGARRRAAIGPTPVSIIFFACGRQIYSLSRRYSACCLPIAHTRRRTSQSSPAPWSVLP